MFKINEYYNNLITDSKQIKNKKKKQIIQLQLFDCALQYYVNPHRDNIVSIYSQENLKKKKNMFKAALKIIYCITCAVQFSLCNTYQSPRPSDCIVIRGNSNEGVISFFYIDTRKLTHNSVLHKK